MPFQWRKSVFTAVCLASLTAPAVLAQEPDLTYHTVAPCLVVDTRSAGGAFVASETRTYNVVGTGSLASQGGSSTGCGIPGFSNNIAQVQAVALNIVAFQPTGGGHVIAHAADSTTIRSVVNMNLNVNSANTAPVAVAQTSGVGDFKVTVNISGAHIIISVVGYYSKAVQTVFVHPVPGDHTASGTHLLNALSGITNASATKRYVIKLEPGIYDIGSTMLEMKDYVDIEGSGQEATVIQGSGNDESSMTATVEGADFTELRDLQVKSVGTGHNIATAIALDGDDTTIRNVTVASSGASANWGIRMATTSKPLIENTTINVSGSGFIYGMVTDYYSAPVVRRTVFNVTDAGTSGSKIGIWTEDAGCPKELTDVEINVSGGANAYGIQEASSNIACTLNIRSSSINVSSSTAYGIYAQSALTVDILGSKIKASGSTSYGLYSTSTNTPFRVKDSEIAGATATVDVFDSNIAGTMLDGGAASANACAGVYDESYTFYASTCP